MIVAAFTVAAVSPPQPASQAAPADLGSMLDPTPGASPTPPAVALARSNPTRLTIPKIGVDTDLLALGVNQDDTIQVPPLEDAKEAGWYKLGVSPGEVGNAVIVGHVNTKALGPTVFYKLGALEPGDLIQVSRADESTVTFKVDGVKSYPKTAFPTDLVYGPSDVAGLRLVTCGGDFDQKKKSYLNNVIVFATAIHTA